LIGEHGSDQVDSGNDASVARLDPGRDLSRLGVPNSSQVL